MFINDYGQKYSSKADNAADVITMADVGGIGTLIYHTFRFKDYEYDDMPDGQLALTPLVYNGYEPDVDKDNALNGSDIFAELYNLGKIINDFSEKKSFDELIIEFCKTVAHPYDIDTLFTLLTKDKANIEKHGYMISEEAMFPVSNFKRDIENFYHGAQLYFALRQIADGEDFDYLTLSEAGRHFDGIFVFDRFRIPVMPGTEQDDPEGDAFDPVSKEDWEKIFAKTAAERKRYEQFVEEHKHELYKYTPQPIDDFYHLRGKLMEMIPDFRMRLKLDPKTNKVVFAADVHSVFDIAWYTLARYMVDVQLTDEGTNEKHYSNAKVCVCKCCGKAFLRLAKQNRRQYCGEQDCDRKRVRERVQRKRERDKVERQRTMKTEKSRSRLGELMVDEKTFL